MCSSRDTPYAISILIGAGPRWTRSMDQPRVVAKHRLLVDQVYVCDVHSWNDSSDVQHGVSGKLEVTSRRYTPKGTIVHLPRFRLTLSSKADASGELGRFLDRLRSSRQVCDGVSILLLYRGPTHQANHPISFMHIINTSACACSCWSAGCRRCAQQAWVGGLPSASCNGSKAVLSLSSTRAHGR